MLLSRMRLVAAGLALLACTWISACGGDDEEGEPEDGAAADSAGQPAPTAEPNTAAATKVRVGVTGLILLMPPATATGAIHLFMPPIRGHKAYVGYWKADSRDCDKYNPRLRICFMNMEGARLEPIGRQGNSAGRPGIPRTVVNVFHGSSTKADTVGINRRLRARASLLSGRATDSCALATWRFPPLGSTRTEFASVITWEIPDHQGGTLSLVLQPLVGTSPARRAFTVGPNPAGELELLILHLTDDEFELLLEARSGSGTVRPPRFEAGRAERQTGAHFTELYGMINAPASPRHLPLTPRVTGRVCRIDVLGLRNAVYPSSLLRRLERLQLDPQLVPMVAAGVRTYSCVMASADGA